MRSFTAIVLLLGAATAGAAQQAQPQYAMAESPTILVLKGLDVPQFENEMRHFSQSLGVSCGFCHVRGDFTSDTNPRKVTARRMIEMTQALNQQFFASYTPAEGASSLGRVTCQTCHQGEQKPPVPAALGGW